MVPARLVSRLHPLVALLALAPGLALGVAGCGGKKGTIELNIIVSPVSDPFTSASEVRFTVGKDVKSVPVVGGRFEFELKQQPPGDAHQITVEGLDSGGNLVAFGQTPPINLTAVDQGPFGVWVGRPGTIAPAKAQLPTARAEIAAYGATGLGAVFAGGRDASGAPLSSVAVYDVYTQLLISTEPNEAVKPMSTPRAAAAAVPSSPRGVVFGGAQSTGLGNPAMPLATGELFDPSGGQGLWAAVPADGTPEARSQATTIVLGSGAGMVSGGLGGDGARLSSALLISTGGTARITPISGPMVGRRYQHAAAPARFPDGDGALLIGGLADGDVAPVVERLIGQSFTTYTATGVENRWQATATQVPAGVLLVGGTVPGVGGRVATASVILIPTDSVSAPQRFDSLLPTPRAGHTATPVGVDELLLCGGYDAGGTYLPSCEILGTNPIAWKRTVPGAQARTGHVAVALETGPVLIAGGVGQNGAPLATIDIYTP